jgi:hypothetical protein
MDKNTPIDELLSFIAKLATEIVELQKEEIENLRKYNYLLEKLSLNLQTTLELEKLVLKLYKDLGYRIDPRTLTNATKH